MVFWIILTINKITVYWRKPESNTIQRYKNTKAKIVNLKGTRMVKDGEDWHRLQAMKLKNLGWTFQTVQLWLCFFKVFIHWKIFWFSDWNPWPLSQTWVESHWSSLIAILSPSSKRHCPQIFLGLLFRTITTSCRFSLSWQDKFEFVIIFLSIQWSCPCCRKEAKISPLWWQHNQQGLLLLLLIAW